MAQINLLPWREEARKQKKISFYIRVLGCVLLTIFLLILYHIYLRSTIGSLEQKNNYLQAELNNEQANLSMLNKKKKQKDAVGEKLAFIHSLSDSSYRAVRLFDELARIVPEAVSLTKLVRAGNSITIFGKSQSNLQVTQFMENMTKSKIFMQPVLTEISVKQNVAGDERFFVLKVEQRE